MSTNAVIQVEGVDGIELYKHWDGSPDSTLPWLEWFNKDFQKNRGDDPEYKLAQLVRSSIRDAEKFHLDPSDYTGWGIDASDSHSYEYLYILKNDGTVEISEC